MLAGLAAVAGDGARGSPRTSRPVWRTPQPSAMCSRTESAFSGGRRESNSGRALALGEAGLAGAAAEHAAGLVGAVAAGHGQVSGPPLAVLGAVGIQAAEAGEVVHGRGSGRDQPMRVNQLRYPTFIPGRPKPCNKSRPQGAISPRDESPASP